MLIEPSLPAAAKKNIEEITRVEQRLLSRRPLLERIGESISHFFGSVWFIAAHGVGLFLWIFANTRTHPLALLPRLHLPFDAYPFPLLSLAVGIEFILLTTFVLMNQKHQSRREDHWAHLHLQLSMLTEQEVTKNLQLLNAIARHLRVAETESDPQLDELTQPTPVAAFVGEIEKSREAGERLAEDGG